MIFQAAGVIRHGLLISAKQQIATEHFKCLVWAAIQSIQCIRRGISLGRWGWQGMVWEFIDS